MRVRFLKRYCGYGPGADPTIDDKLATRLIEEGTCEPYDKPAEPQEQTLFEEPAEAEE